MEPNISHTELENCVLSQSVPGHKYYITEQKLGAYLDRPDFEQSSFNACSLLSHSPNKLKSHHYHYLPYSVCMEGGTP